MSMENPLEMKFGMSNEVMARVLKEGGPIDIGEKPDVSHPQYVYGYRAGVVNHALAQPESFTGDPDFDLLLQQCKKVLAVKGKDYTLGKGDINSSRADRLHNFYAVAEFTGVTPFQAWAVYFYKHVSAVMTFAQRGQVESEPIEGRLVGCVNYLMLLQKMIKFEQEKKGAEK